MQQALACFFFFQAEDGIRDRDVTGVQTCALPICGFRTVLANRGSSSARNPTSVRRSRLASSVSPSIVATKLSRLEIGRASCRERVESAGVELTVAKDDDSESGRQAVE